MDEVLTAKEQANKRKGQIAGGIMFLLLIILLLLPLFWYQNPPPGQEGIQVNLGIPDIGMGEDLNAPLATTTETEPVEETEDVPEPEEPVVEEVTPSAPEPEPVQRETVTTEDPAAIALRQQREREAAERREALERERQEAAQRERERQEAERRRQQEAAAQATRDDIGGLFNSGSGGGNTNRPGDGGAENGDPNSTNIGNKSFGAGNVGGGLGSRGVSNSPRIIENSQKSGVVVVSLCVDASGSVIPSSVKFTQRGSTTTDSQLVNAAIRNAKRWGFSSGSVDRQCGTITYNFTVK
ncbi:MAG: energy transducer TonB [Bacteroidota bacterium]